VDPDPTNHHARVVRTVLVVDLVESVRLIQEDEEGAVRRWRAFVEHVAHQVLPLHGGRMVKSLGDGMMLEFPRVQPAVATAFEIHKVCARMNEGVHSNRCMLMRMGIHVSPLIMDERDLYGHGVNLAARLASLAGPGEVVVSADVRDQLTSQLDADIEDLGECYLKHVSNPMRAYRLGPPGPRPVIGPGLSSMEELLPTIAVIPFAARTQEPDHYVFGEVLADEIISAISRTAQLRVISRLSTTAFRERGASAGTISEHLNANYILTGAYRVIGDRLSLSVELVEASSRHIVWAEVLKGGVAAILMGDDDLIERIVTELGRAVLAQEIDRARALALPTLASYTLLMGAIVLMHRGAPHDFERAGQLLEALTERVPRQAAPHAWLAKWHVLRFNRGRSDDNMGEAKVALDCTKRALDNEPNCSLALTIDGFVHTNLLKRLDIGLDRYDLALQVNPNESLAWLLKGTLHAFKGEGALAMEGTERALVLSPLDPLRYFYESLAATAAHSAGRYERAIELAQRSLRVNRVHPSTYRALAIAQSQLGRLDDARRTVGELLKLQPNLTVSNYLESNPSGSFETGKVWAEALRRAGVPE
jgi:class 3 adenylate cyclase/TolB-like protein